MENICIKCPRLVEFRKSAKPKKSHIGKPSWSKPVPAFGDPQAWLLVCGMAPGKSGAHRTGRPFVGDIAGELLYAGLIHEGFCNPLADLEQVKALDMKGVIIDNAVRCAPPQNKPTPREFANCLANIRETATTNPFLTDILCIGRNAFDTICKIVGVKGADFKHGAHIEHDGWHVWASYHTSGYNQNTGRINFPMFIDVLKKIKSRKNA